MNALTYRCPTCGSTVDVTEEMLNQTIICPNESCRTPFELDVPQGEFVRTHEVEDESDHGPKADHALEETALNEERTLRVTHPAMFRRDPVWFSIYVVIAALSLYGSFHWWLSDGSRGLSLLALGVALIAGAMLFKWWLGVIYTTLSVTSKRTILRTGIIAKNTTEVRHDDVRNLQINQDIFERLFGVGDIAISSAGQDDLEIHVLGIPQPTEVAQLIRDLQDNT